VEQQSGFSFSHTADYRYIDLALQARWALFCDLEQEIQAFTPKKEADFADYRASELERLRTLNPSSGEEDLLAFIDGQIKAHTNPGLQLILRFSDRVMAEYVTVAVLAHALSEATINKILAVGLAAVEAADVFALLERADIKEKWVAGPKAFHPSYDLPKGSALYQTLQHLTRQRNAFVHYKIELEVSGQKKLRGSRLDRSPLRTKIEWLRRFYSVPYDLEAHAYSQIPRHLGWGFVDSGPIERFTGHGKP